MLVLMGACCLQLSVSMRFVILDRFLQYNAASTGRFAPEYTVGVVAHGFAVIQKGREN